jgi:hypothetical protein
MAISKDLLAMFTVPDDPIYSEEKSSIEQDFVKYVEKHQSTYHSPNISPSSPINNGAVSE